MRHIGILRGFHNRESEYAFYACKWRQRTLYNSLRAEHPEWSRRKLAGIFRLAWKASRRGSRGPAVLDASTGAGL